MVKSSDKPDKNKKRVRKSPRVPADAHREQTLKGIDGKMWMSLFSPNQGYYRWLLLKKRSSGILDGCSAHSKRRRGASEKPKNEKDAGKTRGPKLFIVELFAGTHSVSQSIKHSPIGHKFKVQVLSVDIEPRYQPTVAVDINTWKFKDALKDFLLHKRPLDIVAVHASPPCTEFSRALTTRTRDLEKGNQNVKSTLRIIRYLKPDIWFIENPVGLLKNQPFMQKYDKYLNKTTYCKYGTPYKKPTNIWSNIENLKLPVCNSQSPCKSKLLLGHHTATAQAGPSGNLKGRGGSENVYHLPPYLVRYLFRRGIEQAQNA